MVINISSLFFGSFLNAIVVSGLSASLRLLREPGAQVEVWLRKAWVSVNRVETSVSRGIVPFTDLSFRSPYRLAVTRIEISSALPRWRLPAPPKLLTYRS